MKLTTGVLALIILAAPFRAALGAAGDIQSASIETNGWVLQLNFQAMGTGGTWDFGFDTNSTPAASNRVILTVTSLGYDADTTPTTVMRVLRGTKQLRLPYPNQALNDVQTSGPDAIARIALDDFVFSNCINLVITVKAGLYSAGGKVSKEAVLSVANNSLLSHPRSIAKWSWPPYWRITNDTYQVRCVAFHRSGMNFQPVRAVKFWGVCEDGTTNEPVIVTNATIDANMGDAVPIIEYIGTLSATNFASSKWVTNHFAVFPLVGNTNAVTHTDDGVNVAPSPYYAPYPLLCDRSNTFGVTVTVVATNGSDSTGRAIDASAWNPGSPPNAFRTINGAVVAIKNSNSVWHARSDAGGGVVYMQEGEYSWTGGTTARGNLPATWLTIDAFPGTIWTNIVFTNRGSSSGFASGMDMVRNVKFKTTLGGTFRNLDKLWLDQIALESAEVNSCFSSPTNVWVTHSILVTNGTIGLDYLSPIPTTFFLVRGNTFTRWGGNSRSIQTHTVIGNLRPDDVTSSDNSTPVFTKYAGKPPKDGKDIVLAFNKFSYLAATAGSSPVNWYRTDNSCDGLVIVQNLLEVHKSTADGGAPVLGVSWSSSSTAMSNQVNNVMIWNNTFVGQRCNLGEDAAGNGTDGGFPHDRLNWSVKNNIFAASNTKHDTEYTPNGGRIYGWPVLYGVGWSGNLDRRNNTDCGPWNFAFYGTPGYRFNTCDDSRTNWVAYVSYRGFLGGTNYGAGGGDYHLTSTSAAINYPVVHPLPYDIEGTDRSLGDASGAYAYPKDPQAPVGLLNAFLTNSFFAVSANSTPGRLYALESTDELPSLTWNALTEVSGTGGVITLVDSNALSFQRFYRVHQK